MSEEELLINTFKSKVGFCFCYEDLDQARTIIKELVRLQQENKELKENYCNRTDCSSRIKDSKKYDSLQQRIDNAIEYIVETGNYNLNGKELLKILKGDK